MITNDVMQIISLVSNDKLVKSIAIFITFIIALIGLFLR